jgi:hypothetical protein
VEEIVSKLLADTAALGVWLLGDQSEMLTSAVQDDSIKPPIKAVVGGETYLEFVDTQIFAIPLEGATLVILFNDRSSLGLIRLRVIRVKAAIQQALAQRRR